MKKLLLFAAFLAPAAVCASTVFVEHPNYLSQSFELTVGISQVVSLGDDARLRVLDIGDTAASVFNLTVERLDANGIFVTLCENQLRVPFDSEATLSFSTIGGIFRFVASSPDSSITPELDANGNPVSP